MPMKIMSKVMIEDTQRVVWISFLIFGFCSLIPWNMLLNTIPFIDKRITESAPQNTTINETSSKMTSSLSILTVAAMVPMTLMSCLIPLVFYKMSAVRKIGLGLIGMITLLMTMLFLLSLTQFCFVATTIVVVFLSCFFSLFQSSLFAMASNFPKTYMTPIIVGQGFAGIVAAIFMNILNLLLDMEQAPMLFFLSGFLVVLFSSSVYSRLCNNNFFLYFTENILPEKTPSELFETTSFTRKTWLYFFTIWLIHVTSFILFPSIILDVNTGTQNSIQYVLLSYNIWDLIGRFAVQQTASFGANPVYLFVLTLVRICVAVAFLFCDVTPKLVVPTVFDTASFFIFLVLFSFSNGYVTGQCFMWAPDGNKKQDLSLIGYLMTVFLSVGLLVGAILAVPLRMVI